MCRPRHSPWRSRPSPLSSRRLLFSRRPRLPHARCLLLRQPSAASTGACAMSKSATWRGKARRSGRLPSRLGCIGKLSRSMSGPTVSQSWHAPKVCSIRFGVEYAVSNCAPWGALEAAPFLLLLQWFYHRYVHFSSGHTFNGLLNVFCYLFGT